MTSMTSVCARAMCSSSTSARQCSPDGEFGGENRHLEFSPRKPDGEFRHFFGRWIFTQILDSFPRQERREKKAEKKAAAEKAAKKGKKKTTKKAGKKGAKKGSK
eukprot:TRINITY_DN7_c0_g1_i6.p3 TRINITY_DN7_c0_g1~~TRINITY_DN7_c0_g1_i6.p3  ORF type:complete len:104 (+),score=15.13 TRINITY_DN7_c0_g1_i6:658-969(+)